MDGNMDSSLFDYELPPGLIARHPAPERSDARMLVVNRAGSGIEHRRFFELPTFLHTGDVLVLNNSRVIPARLIGRRLPGGGMVEALLLKEREHLVWETMVRPGKKMRIGDRIVFRPRMLEGEITEYLERGERLIRFDCAGDWHNVIESVGHVPLPPYIVKARRDAGEAKSSADPADTVEDRERYQTVYAQHEGSVAAPTAGLHFTTEMLARLEAMGVQCVYATLHVGPGTFKPVTEERIEDHVMHSEPYVITEEAAGRINQARAEGRRIVAVGTTSVRILESCADDAGRVRSGTGETSLMIAPGYRFRCVDALITNFHLPRSTLLMLVCALAGRDAILRAYREAVREEYRFYSYGDAMLIV